jgi:hypothetical protein
MKELPSQPLPKLLSNMVTTHISIIAKFGQLCLCESSNFRLRTIKDDLKLSSVATYQIANGYHIGEK